MGSPAALSDSLIRARGMALANPSSPRADHRARRGKLRRRSGRKRYQRLLPQVPQNARSPRRWSGRQVTSVLARTSRLRPSRARGHAPPQRSGTSDAVAAVSTSACIAVTRDALPPAQAAPVTGSASRRAISGQYHVTGLPIHNGTPGSCLAVRIVSEVLTLSTFGAGVSLLVRNS